MANNVTMNKIMNHKYTLCKNILKEGKGKNENETNKYVADDRFKFNAINNHVRYK
jgi:hypothetical protein